MNDGVSNEFYKLLIHTFFFFFQAEDGIRDYDVTGVQTCALLILWDLRTINNQEVAPGLYLFTVESEGVKDFIGKFAVIR